MPVLPNNKELPVARASCPCHTGWKPALPYFTYGIGGGRKGPRPLVARASSPWEPPSPKTSIHLSRSLPEFPQSQGVGDHAYRTHGHGQSGQRGGEEADGRGGDGYGVVTKSPKQVLADDAHHLAGKADGLGDEGERDSCRPDSLLSVSVFISL